MSSLTQTTDTEEDKEVSRLALVIRRKVMKETSADVLELEAELNARVHRLFGLTAEEVKIVEAAGGVR